MRTFIGGSGVVTTPSVLNFLQNNKSFPLANLYVINTAPFYSGQYLGQQFLLTDYQDPLTWTYVGNFKPAGIERDAITSKIGLDADTCQITWFPRDTDILATSGTGATLLTALQGFNYGIFNDGIVTVYRCLVMPNGDANTYGACCMFAGRIGDVKVDRGKVQMDVISRMETLNVMVPPNLIEPTNIFGQYSVGIQPTNAPTALVVAAGTNSLKVYATATGGTPANGQYNTGYFVFTSGKLAGYHTRIRQQTIESGYYAFYLYQPLPFLPANGDALTGYIPVPLDLSTAQAMNTQLALFPYVPVAVDSSVVVA